MILTERIAIYIPAKYPGIVRLARQQLAQAAGGSTAHLAYGGWINNEGKYETEDVYVVEAWYNMPHDDLVRSVATTIKDMLLAAGEQAVAYETEGTMHVVTQ